MLLFWQSQINRPRVSVRARLGQRYALSRYLPSGAQVFTDCGQSLLGDARCLLIFSAADFQLQSVVLRQVFRSLVESLLARPVDGGS